MIQLKKKSIHFLKKIKVVGLFLVLSIPNLKSNLRISKPYISHLSNSQEAQDQSVRVWQRILLAGTEYTWAQRQGPLPRAYTVITDSYRDTAVLSSEVPILAALAAPTYFTLLRTDPEAERE